MAEYANAHFETYVKEVDLQQQILNGKSGARLSGPGKEIG